MLKSIELIRGPRELALNQVKDLTLEQLNHVPQGFNNNIIWNIAHMISGQQGIFYTRAGLPVIVDDKYYTPYRPETKPTTFVGAEDVAIIKELFLSTIDQLETDVNNNLFVNYPTWSTRYGTTVNSVETALAFLPFHEGLHFGYMMALKRVL
ncbi:DinB family protein [Mucilaginibacter sp.]|uniref:DinB family protein n=1 Tax=Mucilaginibacter sp. TaxID=1882438 RepID=UPI0025DD2E2A|nr:DinB family protein [Mucilaginibacter sp.]